MAPQTPDKATAAKVADHPVVVPGKNGETATEALQRQANDLRHEGAKPNDAAKVKPVEVDIAKVADHLKLDIKPEDLKIVSQEHDLKETRRALIDQIKNPQTDAKVVQATQDKFKKQVGDSIATATDLSKGAVGDRPIDRISSSMAATERHQADLEKELKINPSNQANLLKGLLSKDAASLSPSEKDYVETLAMKETLRHAKESASVTNAVYGSAVAQGLIGDLSHRDAKGMATPSNAEVAEAFTKMGVAQRLNGESREAGAFKDDYSTIVTKYTDQLTATGRSTLDDISKASENWHKNPTGAESLLRSANYTVDGLNLAQIQQQIDANKNNPDIAEKLGNVLKVASSARLEYASFLYEHGRVGEAQARLAQAKAETPAQCASDPSYKQLVDNVGVKTNVTDSSIQALQASYRTHIDQREWDQADVAAKHLQDETNTRIKQQELGKADLDKQQTELQQKIATAKTQTEKDALTNQIAALKNQANSFDEQKKVDTANLAYLSYQQGFVHLSEKNMAQANADFKRVGELDPEMAKKLNEMPSNELPKLDDLIKQTKEPSWWQRNWRTVAGIGIGIGATIAIGVTGGAALPVMLIIAGGGGIYAGLGATAGETSGKQVAMNFGIGCATTALSLVFKGVGDKLAAGLTPAAETAAATATGVAGSEVANVTINTIAAEGLAETAKATATEVTKQGLTVGVEETGKQVLTETGKQVATETGKAALVGETNSTASLAARALAGLKAAPGTVVNGFKAAPGAVARYGLNSAKEFVAIPTLKQASAQLGLATTGLAAYEGIVSMHMHGETAKQVSGHLLRDALIAVGTVRGASALGAAPLIENAGVTVPSTVMGFSIAAAPNALNYYNKNQTFDQAVQSTLTDGAMTSMVYGLSNQAAAKFLTADKLFAEGTLSKMALAKGLGATAFPYASQEGLTLGYQAYSGENKPIDPTTGRDKITEDYVNVNQYNDRVLPDAPAPDFVDPTVPQDKQ